MKNVLLARDALSPIKYMVPKPLRSLLRRQRQAAERRMLVLDRVTDWSVLRRLRPYRSEFGGRRGKYIDRFYIEAFLRSCQDSIRGRVAEIQSDEYTKLFGQGRVAHSDILDLNENNDNRTSTIDLTQTASVPENAFDCIICTQTLLLIRDYASALRSLYKMLNPSGVLLVTVPGISPIVRGDLIAGEGADSTNASILRLSSYLKTLHFSQRFIFLFPCLSATAAWTDTAVMPLPCGTA